MGKVQKKHSKGRLDQYYNKAKEKGYRARSSFKILQINERFGHFLEKAKVVIDLCAAPGSWCQVATEKCPVNSLIIGVDIVKIKPLPNVITFQSDITTEHCRSELRSYMKTWKADVVMHDGAPNVGKDWTQDAFTQSELVLQSLKLAVEFLTVGGTFVTKVFRSKDYNKLMWVFQQFFERVEATKPPASRNVSAEIFVVCKKFKAPKKFDPKLLDASIIFEDIQQVSNESLERLLKEKKKRKRDGYEENEYLQFKQESALEFIKSNEPVQILATLNALTFDKKDPDLKKVNMLESTTPELLTCLADLKVLGRREFRLLLKWRKNARELLELDKKKDVEENAEGENEEEVDEETKIDRELQNLQEKERLSRKREKRKLNEKKQKEITRMQMDMVSDMRVGSENNEQDNALFDVKKAERSGKLNALMKGKNALITEDIRDDVEIDGEALLKYRYDDRSDDEIIDDYEAEMDAMYEDFKERQSEKSSAYRAKRARENGYDDEWYGIKDEGAENEDDDGVRIANDDSEDDWDSDEEGYQKNILNTLAPKKTTSGLSTKAALFFDDPLFRDVDMTPSSTIGANGRSVKPNPLANASTTKTPPSSSQTGTVESDEEDSDDDDIDASDSEDENKDDWNEDDEDESDAAPEIVTPQAMTIAHDLALGNINKHRLVDESFGRYSFHDRDGLPEWFLDDEQKHNRVIKPITKEAAEAIKAKMKSLNARPIKKIAEAKARKQMRRERRLEKLRKKTEMINEDGALSERDKAEEIQKLTRKYEMGPSKKGKKKEKPKVTLVVARGGNRGVQGRPRGVKGKYKMVDGTMKKEQRALRRIQKKNKK